MLTTHRKQQILSILKKQGQVVAKEVSQTMGVSEDTIRRDLREMALEGLLQRVHGGALPSSPAVADFAERERITPEGKVAIGRAAAKMIQPAQVVILDGGTTARQVARHIPLDQKLTIVTHSPTIALELINHVNIEVILIGGRLFRHSLVAVGAPAVEAIAQIHADIYFMGVTGIHPNWRLRRSCGQACPKPRRRRDDCLSLHRKTQRGFSLRRRSSYRDQRHHHRAISRKIPPAPV
jgi:DeoR/GlpR family transcriptional regulator of sugar metabolism